ncbi:MAG: 3-dehydroquinate synthase [Bacteroidetes bacterium]|nr:3-dehydroquinate synthase [Bacteroidota bacterium]
MQTSSLLTVGLGPRAYDIFIGRDLIASADRHFGELIADRHVIIITDTNVAPLHLAPLIGACQQSARRCDSLSVAAGEASKSMSVLSALLEDILALGVDRDVVLIALGGGVVGDLAGFAAASLMRGVDFIQVPTSLLAQVDSSVGGKTGVNAQAGKNLIGAFHQPRAVLIDTATLDSLSARELRAGYAEIVKYGLLGDAAFFEWLEGHGSAVLERDPAALTHAIVTSCAAKARIVEADELETGQRALLNLGHTFGHAFEAVAGYDGTLIHGEAVAAGMGLAFDLAAEMELCSGQDSVRAKAHLRANGLAASVGELPVRETPTDQLIALMQRDKKVRKGEMRFVLPRGIGNSFVCDNVSTASLHKILETSRSWEQK